MKTLIKILPVICTLLCLWYLPTPASEADGGYAGAFLRMGVGSQAAGLGNAFTALTNDAGATYWNPAALGLTQNRSFSVAMNLMTLDRKMYFTAYSQPVKKWGVFGIGWLNYGVSDIDGRDELGQKTEKFDNSEMAFLFSYSNSLFNIVSIGANAKYLHHALATHSANGLGFDFGLKINFKDKILLGIVAQDYQSRLKWNTASKIEEKIPLNIRAGLALTPFSFPLTFVAEARKNEKQSLKFHGGLEYWLLNKAGLRAGYNDGEIAFGAGVRLPFESWQFQFDYAYTNDVLQEGAIHCLGLNLVF